MFVLISAESSYDDTNVELKNYVRKKTGVKEKR